MGKSFVENHKKLTDNELILLINQGEYENLQILIDRYLPLIKKIAKKYCPENELEDAVQEAVFGLYSAIRGFDPQKSTFVTFASLCIKRSVIDHLRKSNTQKNIPTELLTSIEDAEIPVHSSPESILLEKEAYTTLTDNIRLELSGMEYSVLQLFLESKSYKEIADIMQISEKSVDNALARIRKKIKNNG